MGGGASKRAHRTAHEQLSASLRQTGDVKREREAEQQARQLKAERLRAGARQERRQAQRVREARAEAARPARIGERVWVSALREEQSSAASRGAISEVRSLERRLRFERTTQLRSRGVGGVVGGGGGGGGGGRLRPRTSGSGVGRAESWGWASPSAPVQLEAEEEGVARPKREDDEDGGGGGGGDAPSAQSRPATAPQHLGPLSASYRDHAAASSLRGAGGRVARDAERLSRWRLEGCVRLGPPLRHYLNMGEMLQPDQQLQQQQQRRRQGRRQNDGREPPPEMSAEQRAALQHLLAPPVLAAAGAGGGGGGGAPALGGSLPPPARSSSVLAGDLRPRTPHEDAMRAERAGRQRKRRQEEAERAAFWRDSLLREEEAIEAAGEGEGESGPRGRGTGRGAGRGGILRNGGQSPGNRRFRGGAEVEFFGEGKSGMQLFHERAGGGGERSGGDHTQSIGRGGDGAGGGGGGGGGSGGDGGGGGGGGGGGSPKKVGFASASEEEEAKQEQPSSGQHARLLHHRQPTGLHEPRPGDVSSQLKEEAEAAKKIAVAKVRQEGLAMRGSADAAIIMIQKVARGKAGRRRFLAERRRREEQRKLRSGYRGRGMDEVTMSKAAEDAAAAAAGAAAAAARAAAAAADFVAVAEALEVLVLRKVVEDYEAGRDIGYHAGLQIGVALAFTQAQEKAAVRIEAVVRGNNSRRDARARALAAALEAEASSEDDSNDDEGERWPKPTRWWEYVLRHEKLRPLAVRGHDSYISRKAARGAMPRWVWDAGEGEGDAELWWASHSDAKGFVPAKELLVLLGARRWDEGGGRELAAKRDAAAASEAGQGAAQYVAATPWHQSFDRDGRLGHPPRLTPYDYVRRADVKALAARWDDEAERWWSGVAGKEGEVFVQTLQNALRKLADDALMARLANEEAEEEAEEVKEK